MTDFVFDESSWRCLLTDKGHHARIYPKALLTENQRMQWDLFNRLPLSNEQRIHCLERILKEERKCDKLKV